MPSLSQDFRHGFRMLAKSPGFTLVALLTLALGIGASTAIFSVVNAVLLRPLAYKDSTSIFNVWGKLENEGLARLPISEPEYWDLIDHNQSFSTIAAYSLGGSANLTRSDAQPVQATEARATQALFPLLGTVMAVGRGFTPEEDQPGHAQFAVLSFSLWQSQFAADPNVLSRTIQLDGESYNIVGVLPRNFSLGGKQDLWVPLALNRAKPDDRGNHSLHVVARLKPSATQAQASGALAQLAGDLRRAYPNSYAQGGENNFGLFVVPIKEELVGGLRPALLVLLGAVLFVLLIACANVANLQLARASSRARELAVRAALGAGRARLILQLLNESALLAVAGGILGLGLAYWGVDALQVLIPQSLPRMEEIHIDPTVLLFALAISLLTAMLFGLAPAWQLTRTELRDTLNQSGRSNSAAGGSKHLRASLVVSELALAVLLLAGAGLLIRSFSRLLDVSPGFRTQHLLTLELSLPTKAYPDGPPVQNFFSRLTDRVRSLPGVQSAGAISQMPFTDSYNSGSVFFKNTPITDLPRYQPIENLPYAEIDQRAATAGYFEAMQISLLRGRVFTSGDSASAPLVAVVDDKLAERFWPNRDAIGQQIALDAIPDSKPQLARWRTVVGVVGHIKHYGLDYQGREQIYVPHAQPFYGTFTSRDMTLAVSTSMDPGIVTSAVREQVAALDKGLALYNVATMDELVAQSVAQPRLNLSLLVAFAALALLLAAIGVYGVMAYTVMQRTQEFGIRMTLGATSVDVLKQVFREGGRLAALGVVLGLIAAAALTRLMSSLLFGVKPYDPVSFAAAAAVLALTALLACYIPARRATRIEPLTALRHE